MINLNRLSFLQAASIVTKFLKQNSVLGYLPKSVIIWDLVPFRMAFQLIDINGRGTD